MVRWTVIAEVGNDYDYFLSISNCALCRKNIEQFVMMVAFWDQKDTCQQIYHAKCKFKNILSQQLLKLIFSGNSINQGGGCAFTNLYLTLNGAELPSLIIFLFWVYKTKEQSQNCITN